MIVVLCSLGEINWVSIEKRKEELIAYLVYLQKQEYNTNEQQQQVIATELIKNQFDSTSSLQSYIINLIQNASSCCQHLLYLIPSILSNLLFTIMILVGFIIVFVAYIIVAINHMSLTWILFAIIIIFLIFAKLKRIKSTARLQNYRNRQIDKIPENSIIVAIEPINTFATISTRKTSDRQLELQVENGQTSKFVAFFQNIFGVGRYYYQVRQKKAKIVAFLQLLKDTRKAELVLYTSLQENVADCLLKKLDIDRFFEKQNRRIFCRHSSDAFKHPSEVDSKTKRVIIVTGINDDFPEEDSQYFLVTKKKSLQAYGNLLRDLIMRNKNIDQFHTQFVNLKLDFQSDFEGHDKNQ